MSEISMEEKVDKAIAVARGTMASRTLTEDMQKVAQSILNLAIVRLNADAEESDEELAFVLGKIRPNLNATELVQLTQAALHLTNARTALTGKTKPKK